MGSMPILGPVLEKDANAGPARHLAWQQIEGPFQPPPIHTKTSRIPLTLYRQIVIVAPLWTGVFEDQ